MYESISSYWLSRNYRGDKHQWQSSFNTMSLHIPATFLVWKGRNILQMKLLKGWCIWVGKMNLHCSYQSSVSSWVRKHRSALNKRWELIIPFSNASTGIIVICISFCQNKVYLLISVYSILVWPFSWFSSCVHTSLLCPGF